MLLIHDTRYVLGKTEQTKKIHEVIEIDRVCNVLHFPVIINKLTDLLQTMCCLTLYLLDESIFKSQNISIWKFWIF